MHTYTYIHTHICYIFLSAKGAFTNQSRGPYGEVNYMTQIAVFTRCTILGAVCQSPFTLFYETLKQELFL